MKNNKIFFDKENFYKVKNDVSQFLILPDLRAKLVSWQLNIADSFVRDVLFVNDNTNFSDIGVSMLSGVNHFAVANINNQEIDLLAASDFVIENDGSLVKISSKFLRGEYGVNFAVNYYFADLFFKSEMCLQNLSGETISWHPKSEVLLNIPWNDSLCLKNFNIKIPAKNIFNISQNGSIFDKSKFSGLMNLSKIVDEHCICFQNFTDNIFKIETLSKEESISFAFNAQNKHSNVKIKIPYDNCVSIAYNNLLNDSTYETLISGASAVFAFEVALN